MSVDSRQADQVPIWTVMPNEIDWLSWGAVVTIGLAVYFIMYLYAKFDRWAEHKSEGTPLAKTIPTLLAVALLYEIFPLGHFNILLPLSAILIAVMADWMRYQTGSRPTDVAIDSAAGEEVDAEDIGKELEEVANV